MEAVKNRLATLGRDAGALVIDAYANLAANAFDGDLDQPARGREAHCIVDDRVERACKAVGLAHHHCAAVERPGEGEPRVARLSPGFPTVDQLFDQQPDVDRTEMRAAELRVGPRCLANVADQPVHPGDIVANDGGKLCSNIGILHSIETVDGRAEGGEGVFELMAYIGGERLDGVDPLSQPLA